MAPSRAAVLGAGSWGTALAKVLADNGYQTALWARDATLVESIAQNRENTRYLPGIALPAAVRPERELAAALAEADVVAIVVPSHALRGLALSVRPLLAEGVATFTATKGIERESLLLPSQVLEDVLPARLHAQLTCLSGPSFAREVARGIPTGVLVAGKHEGFTCRVQEALGNNRLRVYRTDDVVGVELGGALKNVVAIAAGLSDGLGFGHNSRAALITRGLAEMSRLAHKLGAHPLTLSGLSGLGDLVLTCTGELSRNRHVGLELGRGKQLDEVLSALSMVAEGVRTAESAYALARRERVEMPIVEGVYRILYAHGDPLAELAGLMTRAPRPERDDW